ncbi:MAG TPA: metal ABC transporter substrate-binding protein, partial [Acidimicrobiales bacterium]|nr:metal ABC transporter substrate-binding protein [Acidimicrobiales bacterium]
MLVAAGCAGGDGASEDGSGRTTVVAAFFPLAEAVRMVAGDDVEVIDLTPAGAEPHDLELSSDDVDTLLDADLAIVLGGGFQPAVEDVADDRDGPTIDVLDALDVAAEEHSHEEGDEHSHEGEDPHVWLDPHLMADIVEAVAAELDLDATDVVADLVALDERYASTLSGCERDVLVVNHEAFGALADAYGLRQESITGLVPGEEPDPERLDELAALVEDEGVTTVFAEPLLPRRAAETLAREAGVDVATL